MFVVRIFAATNRRETAGTPDVAYLQIVHDQTAGVRNLFPNACAGVTIVCLPMIFTSGREIVIMIIYLPAVNMFEI